MNNAVNVIIGVTVIQGFIGTGVIMLITLPELVLFSVYFARNQVWMPQQYLYFAKTRSNAIIPAKRPEDSGYDIYSCFEEESITLNPGDIKLIPHWHCECFSGGLCIVYQGAQQYGFYWVGHADGCNRFRFPGRDNDRVE